MTQAVHNPLSGFEPQLHPRDSHGRFRNTWGIPEAAKKLIQGIIKHWNSPQFKSDDHAAAYAQQLAKKKPRSHEQQASIDYFMTEKGNEDIQSTLRVGKDDLPQVRNLDGMMTPLPHDLILTRVLGPDAFGLPPERMGEVEEWTGKLLFDHGYAPTNLGTPHPVSGPHITMSILAPHGTKAVVPGDGRAVILDREQPLRVTKVEPDGHGGVYVYAVVAPKQGNQQPARALGKELAPGEVSPAIEATPQELAKRGLGPDGNPLPKEGAPAAPAPAAAPGARPIPPGRDNLGAPPEPGPPAGANAPVHEGRAGVAQQRIDAARAAGREPAKEDVAKAEQEKKLAEAAGPAPAQPPIEGPVQKPAFKDKNLEPGPPHPDQVKKREEARAAQQEAAKAEAPAEAAMTVDELVSKKADNHVIAEHLRAIAAGPKLEGVKDEGQRQEIHDKLEAAAKAFQDDNPMEGKSIVRSLARGNGVEMRGKAGEKTGFDPAIHDAVNADGLKAGDEVQVVRPGAVMRRQDGALVHLDRAVVRRAGPTPAPEAPKEKVGFGAPKVSRQGRLEALAKAKKEKAPEGPALPSEMARARGEARKEAAAAARKAAPARAKPGPKPRVGGFDEQNLDKNKVADLRAHAKEKGVVVPAGTRKADIIKLIQAGPQEKKAPAIKKVAPAAPAAPGIPGQNPRMRANGKIAAGHLRNGDQVLVHEQNGHWRPATKKGGSTVLTVTGRENGARGRQVVVGRTPDGKEVRITRANFGRDELGVPGHQTFIAHVEKPGKKAAPAAPKAPPVPAKAPSVPKAPSVKAPRINNVDDLDALMADLHARGADHNQRVLEIKDATKHLDDHQLTGILNRISGSQPHDDRAARALREILKIRGANTPPPEDLNKLLVKDLRARAQAKGIKVPAAARKAEIIRLLGGKGPSSMPADGLDAMDLRDLRDLAMEHQVGNAHRMGAPRLIQELRKKGVARRATNERFPSFGTGPLKGNVMLSHPVNIDRHDLHVGDEVLISRHGEVPETRIVKSRSSDGIDVQLDDGSWVLRGDKMDLLSRPKGVAPPLPRIPEWGLNNRQLPEIKELARAHGIPIAGQGKHDLVDALELRAMAIRDQRFIEDEGADVPGGGLLNRLKAHELVDLFDSAGIPIAPAARNRRDLIKAALRAGLSTDPDQMNSLQLRGKLESLGYDVPAGLTREQLVEMLKNPPVLQFHHEMPKDVKKLIDSLASGVNRKNQLGGGAMGETSKVEMHNGTEAIEKIHRKVWGTPPKQQADAEQLASVMGQVLGARNPAVYRPDLRTIFMEFVPGHTASDAGGHAINEAMNRPEAKWIGLLDWLIGNTDRHEGNWMITAAGRPVPIDHGLGWNGAALDPLSPNATPDNYGPFSEEWSNGTYAMDSDEKAQIKAKLEALRPQFALLGREDWLDYSLVRLSKL